MHTILTDPPLPDPGQDLVVDGDEAHHALRVKRLEPGATLRLVDGRGGSAHAVLVRAEKLSGKPKAGGGWRLHARIEQRETLPRTRPMIHVCSGAPKGPRIETLVEGLSQAGAASWRPLETRRSVVDPRENKLAKLDRVAHESAKQSGRAWSLEINRAITLDALLREGSTPLIVADASGDAPTSLPAGEEIRLAVGPEGGFDADELDAARAAGAVIARFGPHTMRIETAAPIACAILLHLARINPADTIPTGDP